MENNNTNLQNQDYYSKTSNKIMDFLIGYIGFFIVTAALTSFVVFVFPTNIPVFSIIAIIILAAIVIFANTRMNKRYIKKGINFAVITMILIPVLFFGACLVSLNNL